MARVWTSMASARVTAVLALLGCLSAQVGAVIHEAMVLHVRCPEHGEMVELRSHVPHENSTESSAHPTVAASEAAVAHGAHEHCGIVAAQRSPATLPAVASYVAPSTATPDPNGGQHGIWLSVDLHAAPKTSPPKAEA